jgi:hypothetical protein
MSAPSQGCRSRDRFTASTQQALVLLLTQQLANAQFQRGDRPGSARLWQEVAALDIEPERITALLYGGQDCHDREALRQLDDLWLSRQASSTRSGWSLQTLHRNRPRLPKRSLSRA